MEKARVYELAKELNTTSKRLMEKLAEINISVKNHMSLLEDKELEALYKHIGIIKHDDSKKAEGDEKKAVSSAAKVDPRKDVKKDAKQAPRIIRTTEIIIDTKKESRDEVVLSNRNDVYRNESRRDAHNDFRGNNRTGQKPEIVRVADSSTGLRPGYIRDDRPAYVKEAKPVNKVETKKDIIKEPAKTEAKSEILPDSKNIQKTMTHNEIENISVKEVKNIEENRKVDEMKKVVVNEENQTAASSQPAGSEKPVQEVKEPKAPEMSGENRVPEHQRQNTNTRTYNDNRQQGGYNRHEGDRPQGGYNRPQGDRPQGGYNRSQGDRPQGGYNRPQGDRPQGGYNRPQGDRPQGGYNRPQGDRPQGGYNRPQGDRPQGGYNRPQGDRPQGGYNRPQGDRPQGGYNRPQGDRPQGGYNRPQGDRPQGGYNRPQGDRPQGGFRSASRPLDIPKIDTSLIQKEEENSMRNEARREFQNKDVDKDSKREQKREVPKGQAGDKDRKFKNQKFIVGQKKGVSEVLSEDFILEEFYDDDGVKSTRRVSKPKKDIRRENESKHIPHRAVLTSIKIPETITVKDLAEALKKTATEVIKKLMALGMMVTLNNELDFDTASIVASEFGVTTEKEVVVNEEDILFDDSDEENEENLQPRPPVVVVMGHVDHGKTSLLDAIRETNVIDSEAGGITQHIGAYMVKINDRNITFLDTPGHEAFTAMRARGAQVTDIAILVVAADDGAMPQTIEAINHAKAANVSIVVAINKIDKPGANPDKVKQELTEYGLVAEEWGGDTIFVPVSAKKRENIDQLLEMVLLTADLQELKANPDRQAKGTVIEAQLDKNKGPVATVLVQRGTLNVGDTIVTGTTVGRIRAMVDDKGHKIKKAGPSTPVEILGMPEVPEAGEIFYEVADEKVAKQLVEKRRLKQKEQQLKASARVSLDDLFNQIKEGKVKDLNIIVKADVQGSVEAVKQSLEKLSNEEVRVKILHGGVGAITEADVTLAQISNAIIIGFNVRPGTNVTEAAQNAGVDMRLYRVIYNAIEDVQAAMKGMLEPTFKEVIQGHAEIRQTFKVSGVGTIAGSYVTDGKIIRNSDVRVVRGGIVVHEGKLASLKRFKDDAKEVAQGFECGLSIERFNDIKEGDIVESYIMEEVAR
ncbi:MAG: translation initiation factor IF-2 [Clostridia bacterium]|nr:translation initiation factor IF-2 [Clostridia bacterium]